MTPHPIYRAIYPRKLGREVLDEITGFARSRHPVKVHCYQWTTSNYKWWAMLPPGWSLHQLVTALYRCSRRRYCLSPKKERASGHLAIQQFTKAHSGCSPSSPPSETLGFHRLGRGTYFRCQVFLMGCSPSLSYCITSTRLCQGQSCPQISS